MHTRMGMETRDSHSAQEAADHEILAQLTPEQLKAMAEWEEEQLTEVFDRLSPEGQEKLTHLLQDNEAGEVDEMMATFRSRPPEM